jgi:alkyl hydroperoxide reductase subunit AhpF
VLLSESDRNTVQAALAAMTDPVRVQFFTQALGCETCLPTRQVLDEIALLSDRLQIDEHNFLLDKDTVARYGIEHVPALAIVGESDPGIRFYGAPFGYEFLSLIEAIVMVSRGEPGLSDESRALLDGLESPLRLRVFVTPT